MTNETKNVPELRFPEFDGEWEEDKLRDLLKDNVILEQSDGNHGELYPKSSEFTEDGIPYLAASNISNNSISYQNIKYLPLERAKQFKKGVARDGDILLAHNATVGPSVLLKTDFPFVILSTTLTLYRINKVKMDNHFFLNEIRSNNIQNQLKKLMKQTTRNQVPILLQRTMHITYPKTLAEQHKIGSFFSKLDRQIELEEQKLAKLEEQKKGYMQKIFSQELRFKDENGNEYPEWENQTIENLLKERNERSSEGDMLSVTINSGIIKFNELDRKDNSSKDKSNYKVVKKNDIAYNSMRMWQGASGKSEYDGIVSPAYTVVYPLENVNSVFIAYLFKTYKMIHIFKINSQGLTSDTWNLKYKQLKDINIKIPILAEQERIAEFFKNIDKLIEKQSNKLKVLNENKKGYLQKMFI
ncbi:restriction endonuclease subunit S [Mammaliicoccus sciuri]|uniref:restriction endonuclease subunit S n=1 Tax=Mammaliicoccus sciuri TaxID=1296 RepID=UPI001E4080C8|nr:restriction endonuclease subunit S [Mammaliicoccus sciuri]MCD8796586.1 restriction endonuclease subunit S [Mammaliicoccus sciuri]